MHFVHFGAVKMIMKMRTEQMQRQTGALDLLHYTEVKRQSWLGSKTCRFLGRLGHDLIVAGERLQRYSLPQAPA